MASDARPRTAVAGAGALLRSWAPIEQAKGMVALMFAVTPEEAFLLLRVAARQQGLTVRQASRRVIAHAAQPPGGDLELVRGRLTIFLFSELDAEPAQAIPDDFIPGGLEAETDTVARTDNSSAGDQGSTTRG